MADKSALYYECHVTLETPKSDVQKQIAALISEKHGFKLARFNMLPDGEEARAFTSGRDESYASMVVRAKALCDELNAAKLYVQRCKIEDTLFDTKIQQDIWGFTSVHRTGDG